MPNTRSRKWLITINNPIEKNFGEEQLYLHISAISDFLYSCYSYETGGEEHTYHVHIFMMFKNARQFNSMQKKFPGAHLDMAKGTAQQNRDYIRKEGKYLNSEKHLTSHIETFREFGECPIEEQGARNDNKVLYELIEDGYTDNEIITYNPNYINQLDKIPKIRSAILEDKYSKTIRNVDVTYIWGDSGSGKTSYVAKKYGYENIYRITDYLHPFDNYNGQNVIVFEEFRSQLRIYNMLNYLDIHPCILPCRYANKHACYTKIYIITNIPLEQQYTEEQFQEKETYKAFVRRIHHYILFRHDEKKYYENYWCYISDDYKLLEEMEINKNDKDNMERKI